MSLIRRRKLTKNQTRQIQKNYDNLSDDRSLAVGVVVSHFGKQLDVQITQLPIQPSDDTLALGVGEIWRCHARTNLPMMTVGDEVRFSVDKVAKLGRIEALEPRRTLITRPDRYHKVKPVAANVDVLVIVFAPLPKPAVNLIDRYLLVARLAGVEPLLVLNKSDLLADDEQTSHIVQEYQELGRRYGFEVICTAQTDQASIDKLQHAIADKLAIFAGQSGVGKSSLINKLLPNANQSTNIISINSQLGQHTTTTSRLMAYDDGDLSKGGIIDTPGIREYGIWHLAENDIIAGFDELMEFFGTCQFRDCNHAINAKGCAFRQAVSDDKVLERRVESFVGLVAEAKLGMTKQLKNKSAAF